MCPELSYLVCGTPRSGTNLLCGVLKATGVAGRPEEYFWRGHESAWAERWGASEPTGYLLGALNEGTSANGVFGAKLMWPHLADVLDKLRAVHGGLPDRELLQRSFPRTRFVWIRRDDLVAQAVSFSMAIQTDEWTADAVGRTGGEPEFDFEQIHRFHRDLEAHNEGWRRWFERNGICPHEVRYESLSADMAGTARGVLAFLGIGLPADARLEPQHERQADGLNAEWAARYRQMVP
jgi:trehalose 2-sulfotransferase